MKKLKKTLLPLFILFLLAGSVFAYQDSVNLPSSIDWSDYRYANQDSNIEIKEGSTSLFSLFAFATIKNVAVGQIVQISDTITPKASCSKAIYYLQIYQNAQRKTTRTAIRDNVVIAIPIKFNIYLLR